MMSAEGIHHAMRIIIILFVCFSVRIALGASALAEYLETSPLRSTVSGGTLANEWCSFPKPVFKELTDTHRLPATLKYLSDAAASSSAGRDAAAKRMIVQAFYLYIKGESVGQDRQTEDGFVSFSVPRVFFNAIMQGFPENAEGWKKWLDDVLPRIRNYHK